MRVQCEGVRCVEASECDRTVGQHHCRAVAAHGRPCAHWRVHERGGDEGWGSEREGEGEGKDD